MYNFKAYSEGPDQTSRSAYTDCKIALGGILGIKGMNIITKYYENSLFKHIENFTTKNENFKLKDSGSFHIPAQNIDCVYSLGPLGEAVLKSTTIYVFEQKSMFLSRNKKINVYPYFTV